MERVDASSYLVLLADRGQRFLQALEACLRRLHLHPERVGERESCVDAVRRLHPDALVLGEVPGDAPVASQLCRVLEWGDVPVLVLLARPDVSSELTCFRLGADDVVVRPVSPRLVAARVARLLRRPRASGERLVSRLGSLEVDRHRCGASVAGRELPLTPVEYRLLAALAGAPGRAFSRSELIAESLPESDALERTIDVHVWSLRRKLALEGAGRMVETVRGVGYRISGAAGRAVE